MTDAIRFTVAGARADVVNSTHAAEQENTRDFLLDLDGTLTDPLAGFVASINHALIGLGLALMSPAAIAVHIGPPLEETLAELLGPQNAHRLDAAVAFYAERYWTQGVLECTVYPGIPSVLESLQDSGTRMFLATSKPTILAQRILDHFELSPHFSGVYGCELDGTRGNKGELLEYLIERESLSPDSAVMVGDRAQDIWAAQKNGISSIGVLWGYGSREELEGAGATTIVETPNELLGTV